MNDILFIIQARMGSTRLPGKVLRRLGSNRLLDMIVHRVRQSAFYQKDRDNLVIATSDKETDDILEAHCVKHGFRVFRGSEERVLDRFVKVIEAVKPTVVIRLTGENPFVDPELLDMMIQAHLDQGADYTYILNTPLDLRRSGQRQAVNRHQPHSGVGGSISGACHLICKGSSRSLSRSVFRGAGTISRPSIPADH